MEIERLRKIDFFESVPDEELERFAEMAESGTLDEGKELVKAGTWPHHLYAIEEGEVEVRRDGDKIATLGEGDVVGETGVVKRGLRNATVVATEPVRVIAFTQEQVKKMRKALPELDQELHDLLEKRSS